MKSQNEFLPKSLTVLPSLDCFNPGADLTDSDGGSAAVASPFDIVDVQMISANPVAPGGISNYTEVHLESPAEGGTIPITANEDTDRVMLLMGLPKPGADWHMSLLVSNDMGEDTVKMQGIEAKYTNLRDTLVDNRNLRHEVEGLYFTIELGTEHFETYVNINQALEVVKLSYTRLETFDSYCVSFLTKSNV